MSILKMKYEDYWEPEIVPYSYQQFEQAFWHLWTLNTYHITFSFDVNMVVLLDWGISYHMGLPKKLLRPYREMEKPVSGECRG